MNIWHNLKIKFRISAKFFILKSHLFPNNQILTKYTLNDDLILDLIIELDFSLVSLLKLFGFDFTDVFFNAFKQHLKTYSNTYFY
jgi:hypothetical protein